MLKVVTGCDDYYVPGVLALANSIDRNVPDGEIEFYCMYFGDVGSEAHDVLEHRLDIEVIANPQYPANTRLPVGGQWVGYSDLAMKAMYCRILLPDLFPDEDRVLWLDADTLVMQSLAELETLDFESNSTAQATLATKVSPRASAKDGPQYQKHCCAVLLYNVPQWKADRSIFDGFVEMMNTYDGAPGGVVETLMNEYFQDRVLSLGPMWHINAKRKAVPKEAKILHFPVIIPWDLDSYINTPKPKEMVAAVKKIWEPYA
jgi:lipopolysaccharide biosynthesis glycosyltransferase